MINKKMIKYIYCIVITMFICLIPNLSKSALNWDKIKDEGDFAVWVREHQEEAYETEAKEFISKKLTQGGSLIRKLGTCLYHYQGANKGEKGTSQITDVIDINKDGYNVFTITRKISGTVKTKKYQYSKTSSTFYYPSLLALTLQSRIDAEEGGDSTASVPAETKASQYVKTAFTYLEKYFTGKITSSYIVKGSEGVGGADIPSKMVTEAKKSNDTSAVIKKVNAGKKTVTGYNVYKYRIPSISLIPHSQTISVPPVTGTDPDGNTIIISPGYSYQVTVYSPSVSWSEYYYTTNYSDTQGSVTTGSYIYSYTSGGSPNYTTTTIRYEMEQLMAESYTYIGPLQVKYNSKAEPNNFVVTVEGKQKSNIEIHTGYTGDYWTDKNATPLSIDDIKNTPIYIKVKGENLDSKETNVKLNFDCESSYPVARMFLINTTIKRDQHTTTMTAGASSGNTGTREVEWNIAPQSYGNLEITKLDQDMNTPLNEFSFIIKSNETGKYIQNVDDDNMVKSWTTNEDEAYEFITGTENGDGKIIVEQLKKGDYTIIEIGVGSEQYEVDPNNNKTVINVLPESTTEYTTHTIYNRKKYINITGLVWESIVNGMVQKNDNRYTEGVSKRLKNVIVSLKDKTTGQMVLDKDGEPYQIITSEALIEDGKLKINQGEFIFELVEIDKLPNYYVEFVYNGIAYESVLLGGDSVATDDNARPNFNAKYATIVQGAAINSNTSQRTSLSYSYDNLLKKSTHTYTGLYGYQGQKFPIIATGSDYDKFNILADTINQTGILGTGLSTDDLRKMDNDTLENVNLGVYEREHPDLSLVDSLQNIEVTINGYKHTYDYKLRYLNKSLFENVQLKMSDSDEYKRELYREDVAYVNNTDKSKELQISVTYRVTIQNDAVGLDNYVNQVVNYFDSNRFTVEGVSKNIDKKGNLAGQGLNYNVDGNKLIINNVGTVSAQGGQEHIFIRFKINKDMRDLMIGNQTEKLYIYSEISAYSTYYKGTNTVYAGIDKDSQPGNFNINDIENTMEDDSDMSRGLYFTYYGSDDPNDYDKSTRKMSGVVFFDNIVTATGTGNERLGNGVYEANEHTINKVKVQLLDENNNPVETFDGNSFKVQILETSNGGKYKIAGFIPGKYKIQYTWGNLKVTEDLTIDAQDYKSTIYNDKDRQNNLQWYRDELNRYSDGMDDEKTRNDIDEKMHHIDYNQSEKLQEEKATDIMISRTPVLEVFVEQEDTVQDPDSNPSTYKKYLIDNIDLGITERPLQEVALKKRLKHIELILANGQQILNIDIAEDGTITGEKNYFTYMGPSNINGIWDNGFAKIELDNELIQGATLKVIYEIKITNTSEIDYDYRTVGGKNYYNYGIKGTYEELVKITPTEILDYLDDQLKAMNEGWTQKDKNTIKDLVSEETINSDEIKNRIILSANFKDKLAPTEQAIAELHASRLLSTSDEISFDNDAEIVQVDKTGGRNLTIIPGNYDFTNNPEVDTGTSETVIVTPSTGENRNFMIVGATIILALGILIGGITIIRKKVL